MKEKKDKKLKRNILIISAVALFTVLGCSLAYFTTSTNITNLFKTALYQNEITENFTSPNHWTPGTTTEKTVKVTNKGSIPIVVRATYTENWINGNGNELPLKDVNNNIAAIIHFNSDWKKAEDGYYYYGSKDNKKIINSEESSSSFISGVTFNEKITATLKEAITNNGKTITYESSGNGYDNAKYILTIKLDTLQYDLANTIW